ncbi:MAG: 50S ribosomal protein L15 [Elusimicrobia bacterium]|nr:50S ribosomal protein L15 [Elusimicrobiota bacterium]
MRLHQLKPVPGSRPRKHIVGRGEGSGWGQTAAKGQKGQSSRSGETIMTGFEGGQTPMVRRIPKRGFNHPSKIHYEPINLIVLENRFDAGAEVNGKTLFEKGVIRNADLPVKILGVGKLTKALKVNVERISKSAEKALKAAGGSFTTSFVSTKYVRAVKGK